MRRCCLFLLVHSMNLMQSYSVVILLFNFFMTKLWRTTHERKGKQKKKYDATNRLTKLYRSLCFLCESGIVPDCIDIYPWRIKYKKSNIASCTWYGVHFIYHSIDFVWVVCCIYVVCALWKIIMILQFGCCVSIFSFLSRIHSLQRIIE